MENNRFTRITTDDGSISLFSNEFGECMHTKAGAYEESVIKHVTASKILLSQAPILRILDIGFGLGYNILALLKMVNEQDVRSFIEVTSLEYTQEHLDYLTDIYFHDERDDIFKQIVSAYISGEYTSEKVHLRVLFGDARKSVFDLVKRESIFDAIFHDPFSPSKNPELWSVDFFKMVKRVMSEKCILTTYSAAPQIRSALLQAGFTIGKAASTGTKREGTIATIDGNIEAVDKAEIEELMKNPKSTVYRDENLISEREVILKRRIEEMSQFKNSLKPHSFKSPTK